MEKKRGSFKGSLGFVLAAAGSAVGLGNIWRFPYLAARDGGGLFLVIYIALAVTFGFTLVITETAIGRKTRQSPLTAYRKLSRKCGWIGILSSVIPFLILPYYCVIGGWVIKYLLVFLTGRGAQAAADGFFTGFITGQFQPILFMAFFMILCALIVLGGVSGGIEKSSKIMMPLLLFLIIGIAVFSLTVRNTDASGNVTTGLDGLKVYLVPDFQNVTLKGLLRTIMDALGQLFFSLSVAMGILITYGSYMPDDTEIEKSVRRIEFFDTLVALLAGVMIIPAVYVFMGREGMSAGPSLMFISLPKVFEAMGPVGNVVGTVFFAMVLFAAVTSGVSLLEAVVSCFMDGFGFSRRKSILTITGYALFAGAVVCLGYSIFYFECRLPNHTTGQILDVVDYVTNNILMPVVAIATCILVGWLLKPDVIVREVMKNGEKFSGEKMYRVMIRFIAPVLLFILFIMSFGVFG